MTEFTLADLIVSLAIGDEALAELEAGDGPEAAAVGPQVL
jgi:hypothetical protein